MPKKIKKNNIKCKCGGAWYNDIYEKGIKIYDKANELNSFLKNKKYATRLQSA